MRSKGRVTHKLECKVVQVLICRDVLRAVFDECDDFDRDETGGRLLGTFEDSKTNLKVHVTGVIESGPYARRSATSLYQDGDYQAKVFRTVESKHPEIEHVGSWHSHHVNGHPTLSSGDIETYSRTVNHKMHNIDFFYALLVVRKQSGAPPDERYATKHFVLFRGVEGVRELQPKEIQIVDEPVVWPPAPAEKPRGTQDVMDSGAPKIVRVHDQEIFAEQYPEVRPYRSKDSGMIYWKGAIPLVDGSAVRVVVTELEEKGGLLYSVLASAPFMEFGREFQSRQFASARTALWTFERELNQVLYSRAAGSSQKGAKS